MEWRREGEMMEIIFGLEHWRWGSEKQIGIGGQRAELEERRGGVGKTVVVERQEDS